MKKTSRNPSKSRPNQLRYILYARKSSTSEDRQVASVESQISSMKAIAKEQGLKVVEVLSESGSGFKTGRPVFNQMIAKLQAGEADGIIAWKLSRLSRNPDDAGKVIGMLQRGEIKHIRTVDRNWYPEDNVMMIYVEFGLTNQFSKDLSADTRRGLIKKAERGWLPASILPLGYMHSPYKALGDQEIIIDESRFYLIQKALKLVASKAKTPMQVHNFLIEQGLRGKRGNLIAESTWYKILSEPFYAGSFEYPIGGGVIYSSKATPAISPTEFDAIQLVLGKTDKPRPKTHFMPYTGLMKCGECGCSITAEKKRKVQKNGAVHLYTYYHCTKKRGHCNQPSVEIVDLEKQYKTLLASIRIPKAFHEWAMEEIRKDQEKEIADRSANTEQARRNYDECVAKLDVLVENYLARKVPEEYYQRKLAEYEAEKKTLKSRLDGINNRIDERLQAIDDALSFAVMAQRKFESGDEYARRDIISYLGSNLTLTSQVLEVKLELPLEQVRIMAKEVNAVAEKFEPLENADNSDQFKLFLSESPAMGQIREGVRNLFHYDINTKTKAPNYF